MKFEKKIRIEEIFEYFLFLNVKRITLLLRKLTNVSNIDKNLVKSYRKCE